MLHRRVTDLDLAVAVSGESCGGWPEAGTAGRVVVVGGAVARGCVAGSLRSAGTSASPPMLVVVRQLVWTRAAPAAWDHLGGVVEVGGVMMAGGAVDVKSGSVRPPSRSRRVAADGPAVGPGRMVRGGSDLSEWEGRFGPDGLGVGVPTMMPVVAVGGLAGDAESVADVGPAGAPVEGPGDRCVEGVLGSLFGGCGVDGGGECVGAESFGAVHQGCHLRVTR